MSLLFCKHGWLSLSALEINQSFLILIEAKSFAIQSILYRLSHENINSPDHASLFGQDGWILASFFSYVFMDQDFVSIHKNAKKKKNSANIQPFWPHAWSIAHMNVFYSDPYKSGKGRQYKKCSSEPGIWSVDFLFLIFGSWSVNFSTDHTSTSPKSAALKSLSQWYNESYWSAFSLFFVCQFDAKSTSVEGFLANASQPMS